MVKLRLFDRMWVMVTSSKNYIALFSFQSPASGVKSKRLNKKSGVGTLENLKLGL